VECIDRQTGQSAIRLIEAETPEEAVRIADRFGFITGRVVPAVEPAAPSASHTPMREWRTSRCAAGFVIGFSAIFRPSRIVLDSGRIIIDRAGSVLFPWVRDVQEMSAAKVASIHHHRGLIWDAIGIETTGGLEKLIVGGLRKSDAKAATEAIRAVVSAHQQSAHR